MSDLSSFIESQLAKRGIRVIGANSSRPNMSAYCFKGHDDKTPSLSIHKATGKFYCFGCGVHGRSWNDLAEKLDLKSLSEEDLPDWFETFNKEIGARIRKMMMKFELPWDLEPWDGRYRHLGQETLNAIEAYKWFDDPMRCYRILFPIYQYGQLRGWTARRLDENQEMKYRNSPGIPIRDILYPLDVVSRMESSVVVLVEGPYDALRLVNFDIPALAIMGTNNFDKGNIVHLLNAGAKRVIVAMDNEESGEKARIEIAVMLKEHFEVEHFYPPKDRDPGDMPRDPCLLQLWELTR